MTWDALYFTQLEDLNSDICLKKMYIYYETNSYIEFMIYTTGEYKH